MGDLVRMLVPSPSSMVRHERWGGHVQRVLVERQPAGSSVDVWYGGRRRWAVVVVKDPSRATRVYTSVRLAMAGLADWG